MYNLLIKLLYTGYLRSCISINDQAYMKKHFYSENTLLDIIVRKKYFSVAIISLLESHNINDINWIYIYIYKCAFDNKNYI